MLLFGPSLSPTSKKPLTEVRESVTVNNWNSMLLLFTVKAGSLLVVASSVCSSSIYGKVAGSAVLASKDSLKVLEEIISRTYMLVVSRSARKSGAM